MIVGNLCNVCILDTSVPSAAEFGCFSWLAHALCFSFSLFSFCSII